MKEKRRDSRRFGECRIRVILCKPLIRHFPPFLPRFYPPTRSYAPLSNRLVSDVSDLALPRAPKEVLRALCDAADDVPGLPGLGVSCYPSNERIAWKSDYVERQVQRALRALESLNIAVPVAVHPVYGTTEYEIHLERAPKKPPFQPKKKRGPGRDRDQLRK